MIFFAVYLLYSLIIVFIVDRLMGVFFEKRRTTRPVLIGSYFLFFVLSGVIPYIFAVPFLALILSILALFMVTLNYEASMKKRFAAVIFGILFSLTFELIALSILGINPFIPIEDFDDMIYLITIKVIPLFIFISLLRSFKNIRKNMVTSTMFGILNMLIPTFSLILLVVFIENILIGFQGPQYIILIIAVMILGINIVTFYFQDRLLAAYEEKLKSKLDAQEKEYYFSQCQLMQESVERMKAIRHDMKAHLSVLKDFTLENKQAADYLNNLLGGISESEIYSDTGNIAFDSIINFKLKNALEDGLKVDVNILIPSILNIEVTDVVIILGNLIDNALEATAKVDNKSIKLDINFDRGGLLINIENSFDGEIKYADGGNEEEKLLATLKNDGEHGYGLKNVRKSVEKYNGHMDIRFDNNIFYVGILLYLDD